MKQKHARVYGALFAFGLLVAVGVVSADITIGSTSQISLSSSGGAPAGSSGSPVVAPNGKVLAFRSSASNIVSGDDNRVDDIFIRDLKKGTISRASVGSTGIEVDHDAKEPAISPVSPDGLFAIAFSSTATSISPIPNSNLSSNIYLRVPAIGLTEMISFAPGAQPADGDSSLPSITLLQGPNRVRIAYTSKASNLTKDDINNFNDIYLSSALLPASGGFTDPSSEVTTIRISVGQTNDGYTDGDSSSPQISGDGRYIVFASNATNLLAGQTTSEQQIFRYAIDSGEMELISKDANGVPADETCDTPSISFSGRFVTYITRATNLVSGGSPDVVSVIMHDLMKGTIRRINTSSSGVPSLGNASSPAVSGNGRFVAFSDTGNNLVSDDANGVSDVFLKDLDNDTTVRISTASGAEPDGASDTSVIAGDSYNSLTRALYFRSFARNLTSPSTASGAGDIFARNATLPAPQLKKGSLIEAPADVAVRGKRSVITAQKFSFPKTSPLVQGRSVPETVAAAARAARVVTYQFRVQGTGKRRNVRQDLVSKRNQITTGKLPPGVYNTRYRVTATQGKKVVSKTPFSPRQQFTIRN